MAIQFAQTIRPMALIPDSPKTAEKSDQGLSKDRGPLAGTTILDHRDQDHERALDLCPAANESQ